MESLELWPLSIPFREDFLSVGNIHTIKYSLYGNPEGEPVFFIHGGPGGGCDEDDARWFDPDKYLIVTYDQRGCGKSIPLVELKENNTQLLVDDIETLRVHLKIDKPISIFAGSWGSTLALLYAEKYPYNVLRMILRGIFTCTYEEQDYFYSANGAAKFSPVAWNKLITELPDTKGRIQEVIHKLIENSNGEERKKWCTLLAEYEYSFFNLSEEDFENEMSDFDKVFTEMRLNIYYQANRFFLKDNEILDNIDKIGHIPLKIMHGTLDLICPPVSAWNLHKHLPDSELILIPNAGHHSGHPEMRQALLKAVSGWK
jgi:proline iminopeptidase